jgi:hypothetical protein
VRNVTEQLLARPKGLLAIPKGTPRSSVLVLAGSSGRVDADRARLLARAGAVAMAVQWFGGDDQPSGICEIALEQFLPHLDALHEAHPNLVVLGTSKGAEAALLLGCRDARIRMTVALSPSSVVWANLGAGVDGHDRPYRSCWTWAGKPLPFVPYDSAWTPPDDRPLAYRGLYEQSLRSFSNATPGTCIPVEEIAGKVVLSAGADDQVWPSDLFAEQIVCRRARQGLTAELLQHPGAGHRLILPGEVPASGGAAISRGGTVEADTALGEQVWQRLRSAAMLD